MPDPVSHGQMMNYLVRNSEDKKRMREYFKNNNSVEFREEFNNGGRIGFDNGGVGMQYAGPRGKNRPKGTTIKNLFKEDPDLKSSIKKEYAKGKGADRIINELSSQMIDLKNEIDRLLKENANLKIVDSSHQKLNGELQTKVQEVENEVRDLKRDNKYLAKQVEDYREILKKAGL